MGRKKGSFCLPTYRLHKSSGQAVVTIAGRDHYLGKHGTPDSFAKYQRLVAESKVTGMTLSDAGKCTVAELAAGFWKHAKEYYKTSKSYQSFRTGIKAVVHLYGDTAAAEFGPTRLKAVRAHLIETPAMLGRTNFPNRREPVRLKERSRCRRHINHVITKLKQIFRWASENGVVPPSTYHGLLAVSALQPGRTEAVEKADVGPVPDWVVEAAMKFMTPTQKTLVKIHLLTGMRSSELLSMRTRDIDTTKDGWIYKPLHHKNEWRGRDRLIAIGPEAVELLRPYLKLDTQAFIWCGRAIEKEYREIVSKRSKWPRRKSQHKEPRIYRPHYGPAAYSGMIAKACLRADQEAHKRRPDVPPDTRIVPHFHPHQLRHSCATFIANKFGEEAASAVLGHNSGATTRRYVARSETLADRVMGEVG
jgi:integrase